MTLAPPATAGLDRFTLPNGLRVLLQHQPGIPRAAVSVHYGVGFRSEPPGREGFAHLFEHLMFRGSASLPGGRFYDHVHRLGSRANGTTHQDYTDYYQVAPAEALEQALFAEADRMRAPLFTELHLAEQLAGVAEEIHGATTDRPYGGLPWPLLPGVLFSRHANAHDGYGDPGVLAQTTIEDCEEFFTAHYAPGNAVLTVVGAAEPTVTRALIEHHFGGIPARPHPLPPTLHEPLPTADRWARYQEPGVSATVLAMGHRLPDPETDLPGYLAHAVLAALLNRHGAAALGLPSAAASCGFFGPLDARDPDPLVVTAVLPAGRTPEQVVRAISDRLRTWAEDPGLDDAVPRAARLMAVEHERAHADIETRSRALGRLESLFGRAELLEELPGLIRAVRTDQVAEAARALAQQPKAVLVIEPGDRRTRPVPVRPDGPSATAAGRAAEEVGAFPRPGALPVPGPGAPLEPGRLPTREVELPGGPRVVAVADRRSPLVELRWRVPLGRAGWRNPAAARERFRVRARHIRAAARTEDFGGSLAVAVDGEWLDVSGHAPTGRTADWLTVLADLAPAMSAERSTLDRPGTPDSPRTPDEELDDRVRAQLIPHATVGAGTLIAVGELDPDTLVGRAADTLDPWTTVCEQSASAPETAGPPYRQDDGPPRELHAVDGTHVRLLLSVMERPVTGAADEAARFLATAAMGGFFGGRLAGRFADRTVAGFEMYTGRDTVCGVPRAFLRGRVPADAVEEAWAGIRAEAGRLAAEPFTERELRPVRDFCAAQLLAAFDSPAARADLLRRTVSSGGDAGLPLLLPGLLRVVAAEDVSRAAGRLFLPRSVPAAAH
ncbi:M16 family metallopeptidase [Streptomyces kurssanovii]|uniref:Insulinase family protein n=1 Tax=Streptomyces kurssanovii TaxID=67312 RepID=A0ABV3HMZ3_9ACTN